MEMARKFGRRFNMMYNVEFFPEPQSFSLAKEGGLKVPGLDGSGKMGKSEGNCIYLCDEPSVIRKKVMKAVTDSGPTAPNSEKPDVIQNLFTLLEIVSSKDTYQYFDEKWNDCSIRYGDLKKQLAEDIVIATDPIRERIKEFSSNTDLLNRVAKIGAEKARESAAATLNEVRQIIGFRPY
jgi:tryptophanyl-tRNA synthetase